MFKWNEIKSWAKTNNFKLVKDGEIYFWTSLKNQKNGQENSLDSVVKKIYNEITDYKHKDHQDNYLKKQAPSSNG